MTAPSAPQEERRTASPQLHPPPSPQTTDVIGNLMRGPEGRTARLTVISVLLGAMLAAIVTALPPTPDGFVRTILIPDHLLVDLQVLALLLVVFDVWIQFSWGVLLGLAPFDFVGNLLTFVTAVTVIGWALSVADFRWASRPHRASPLDCKPIALMGATAGRGSTLQAQAQVREALAYAGSCTLAQPELSLSRAGAAFDDALKPSHLTDLDTHSALQELLAAFAQWVRVILTGEGNTYAALHARLSSAEERAPRAS